MLHEELRPYYVPLTVFTWVAKQANRFQLDAYAAFDDAYVIA